MFNFCDSFDGHAATADLLKKWNANTDEAAILFNATGGRYGGGCLEMPGNMGAAKFLIRTLRGVTDTMTRQSSAFAFKMTALPTADTLFYAVQVHTLQWAYLAIKTDGNIGSTAVNSGTINLASTGVNLCDGNWHWIEVRHSYASNPSSTTVWVDGVSVLTSTPFEGGVNIVAVAFRSPHEAGAGKTIYIDDFVTYDSTAETNGLVSNSSEPIGDHRFIKCDISGAGSENDFTPSTGSNYQNVDDAVADDDTTYNSGFTSGARDLFAHSNLGITPTSITAAVVNMRARTVDGGTGSLKGSTLSNATLGAGPARTPAGSYAMLQSPLFRNPDGNVAWTGAAVDAAEFGYEVT
jgi:hypothetical protein